MKFTTGKREKSSSLIKWLPVITITLLPSALMAQQFTPEQMLDVMTKSPSNRDVRVNDAIFSSAPDCAQYSFATAQSILSKACEF